jgi:hypothetical protein
MPSAFGQRHGRSAAAIIAVAALALASLHGVIPHHSLGACHECETLASPALLPQPEAIARPIGPTLTPPRHAETRPLDPRFARLSPTRAPPATAAA